MLIVLIAKESYQSGLGEFVDNKFRLMISREGIVLHAYLEQNWVAGDEAVKQGIVEFIHWTTFQERVQVSISRPS